MDISEKREAIAACIVNLKKGLKRIKRGDIDASIKLLLLYDQDIKRYQDIKSSKTPARPVEKQVNVRYETDYMAVNTDRSVEVGTLINKPITVLVINGDNGSWAYPINGTVEETVGAITGGHIEPLAKVQIDKWMKEHRSDEISFMSIYAAVCSGSIVIRHENILGVGQMAYIKGHGDAYPVKRISTNKVWLDNGFFRSLIPHKKDDVLPIKQTEVKYFVIDKWEQ